MNHHARSCSWPVMKLCDAQLQDINPSDVLNDGMFRKCNTYKGGGGYDKFPEIYERRFGKQDKALNDQFVVQLRGCPFKCPYCYVTKAGIHGHAAYVTTEGLVEAYRQSGCSVFHLMGGAPALYLENWHILLDALQGEVFHSDLLMFESEYDEIVLKTIASYSNTLYAVSIKGADEKEYYQNTGTFVEMNTLWMNLIRLHESGVPFYLTFTGMSKESIEKFQYEVFKRFGPLTDDILKDSFSIDLVDYKALHYNGGSES